MHFLRFTLLLALTAFYSVAADLVPPIPTSPIDTFRRLLVMDQNARAAYLSKYSDPERRQVRQKLQEYELLPPNEREIRLRLMELRWHLDPLLIAPVENRANLLRNVPDRDRKLVEERLELWDKLPHDSRKELLEHQLSLDYLIRLEAASTGEQEMILNSLPPGRRARLREQLAAWKTKTYSQRERIYKNFQTFFELSPDEKQKTLQKLSPAERQAMEETIARFSTLTSEERQRAIRAFRKFAELSVEDRNDFLKKAERWEAMTPDERQAWRDVVNSAPPTPPLPPGLQLIPPLPPAPNQGTLLATNLASPN